MTNDGSVALCQFVSDGSFKQSQKTGGWFHRLRDIDPRERRREVERPKKPEPPPPDWEAAISMYCEAVEYERAKALADSLGVTVESLDLLDMGFMGGNKWSFPMFNADRKPVGIRTRTEDGQKRSVKGTKEGLFIPRRRIDGLLVFAEGPTDCASVLDLGFDCIGRPSCHGCEEWSAELSRGRNVAILADNDESEVGTNGAMKLANAIRKTARKVKVLHPPYTKDARSWRKLGASRESLLTIWACA